MCINKQTQMEENKEVKSTIQFTIQSVKFGGGKMIMEIDGKKYVTFVCSSLPFGRQLMNDIVSGDYQDYKLMEHPDYQIDTKSVHPPPKYFLTVYYNEYKTRREQMILLTDMELQEQWDKKRKDEEENEKKLYETFMTREETIEILKTLYVDDKTNNFSLIIGGKRFKNRDTMTNIMSDILTDIIKKSYHDAKISQVYKSSHGLCATLILPYNVYKNVSNLTIILCHVGDTPRTCAKSGCIML